MTESSNIHIIIRECRVGNVAAERKLFELYYGYVLSVCQRYGRSKQEFEEMLNDTFYTVFRYLDRYDEQHDFKPWLRKVCVNCCLKYLKKYHIAFETEEITESNINEPMVLEEKSYAHIFELIHQLPRAYRIVFNLYVIEEYKHHEIAEMLGISVGTSKSNLSRAKQKLGQIMNQSSSILKKKSS